ncbi:MAG: hypothetical protein EOP83_05050 [Verrucomicrobiaceae bacterium]|nr:MAG: hypothetical protein EOP83_05050 [Verrucomicrobiaceae bacterium]
MSSTDTLSCPVNTLDDHVDVVAMAARIWPYEVAYRTVLKKDCEARDWAEQRYGKRGNTTNTEQNTVIFDPSANWVESGEHFRFKQQHDAFEFKMRWV